MPLPAKLESVPPETVISEAVKVVEASLKVKVSVEVEDLEAVGVKPLFHKKRHQKRYVIP